MFKFISKEDLSSRIDDTYIDEIEKEYGFSFPEILRRFYVEHNGDEIVECSFQKHGIDFCVIEMHPLKYGTMPIEKMLNLTRENEESPIEYVPIALDEDYENFYWNVNKGNVLFISEENDEHPIPITDTVEEFFELLNESC